MQSAASAGNLESFTQYAQQFLEVSRKLNASGQGYQVDYAQVLELAKKFGGDGAATSLQQLYAQRPRWSSSRRPLHVLSAPSASPRVFPTWLVSVAPIPLRSCAALPGSARRHWPRISD